jgi:hypothetical protein
MLLLLFVVFVVAQGPVFNFPWAHTYKRDFSDKGANETHKKAWGQTPLGRIAGSERPAA